MENQVLDSYQKTQWDTMFSAVEQMSKLMFAYYTALIKAGFEQETALIIANEFQKQTINRK